LEAAEELKRKPNIQLSDLREPITLYINRFL